MIDLSCAVLRDEPFPCFMVNAAIDRETELALLKWFEDDAPWQLTITDFYEQFEFSIDGLDLLPPRLHSFFGSATIAGLRQQFESTFGASLKERACSISNDGSLYVIQETLLLMNIPARKSELSRNSTSFMKKWNI